MLFEDSMAKRKVNMKRRRAKVSRKSSIQGRSLLSEVPPDSSNHKLGPYNSIISEENRIIGIGSLIKITPCPPKRILHS